ncbi:MAG: ribosomal-processing cysteine protease Prp [Vulcanimicrobiaceae bacterium]
MVEIRIETDSRGRLSAFFAAGHAGWDELGSDVVCAAISTILQTAWLGLVDVACIEIVGERSAGRLSLGWPAATRSRADVAAIVATAARALEQLSEQFPDHVQIRRRTNSARRGPARSSRTRRTQ